MAEPERVARARRLLAQLGVTVADVQAVATALAALTGQPHPLATSLEELGNRA